MAQRRNRGSTPTRLTLCLSTCIVVTLCINFAGFNSIGDDNESYETFQSKHIHYADSLQFAVLQNETSASHIFVADSDSQSQSQFNTLSCQKRGGPDNDKVAADMVYWQHISSDATFTSPFYDSTAPEKFLFFDTDPAGFNNKRISLENFVIMAHAMGRTLVMPPKGFWWGFQYENGTKQNLEHAPRWSFQDFFDIDKIQQAGLKIISMEQFLLLYGLTGKLRTTTNGRTVSFPPNNRTDWSRSPLTEMKQWLQTVTLQINWRPEDCLGAFPTRPNHNHGLEQAISTLQKNGIPGPSHWIRHPTPVEGSVMSRMEEVLTNRTKLCMYDSELQDATYLYYKIKYDASEYETKMVTNIRLLIWFYQFLFFENWHQDLWSKRFIRDHLRYKDELQCAAARVVNALREKARQKHDGNGDYDSFHIRRKEQFEDQYGNLTEATDIYKIAVADIPDGSTVYIATDDTNRSVFQPLMDHYDVYFLHDFQDLLGDLNVNYYSIIDQLVASRGRVFFGAWCSTFTGFINRMRGYRSQKDRSDGWRDGIIESYYYNFQANGKRNMMQTYHPPVKDWYFREFPMAWRDIDHDVGVLEYDDDDADAHNE